MMMVTNNRMVAIEMGKNGHILKLSDRMNDGLDMGVEKDIWRLTFGGFAQTMWLILAFEVVTTGEEEGGMWWSGWDHVLLFVEEMLKCLVSFK